MAAAEPVEATEAGRAGRRHSLLEDVQAVVTATAFISLGLAFFSKAGLVSGGTAGLALLLAKVTPLRFGQLFALLNLPFFWLAWRQMGWRFTLKTFAAIALVSLATDWLHLALDLRAIHPLYAAVLGGFLIGMGLLILFRHQASLGGLNVLALWLQREKGVRAGVFQMAVDSLVVLASLFVVSPTTIALSVVGALALNVVLAVNHRPDRYLGT
jgi:uncharacterized membrane-anchored protein YitT (DUF2179 family)